MITNDGEYSTSIKQTDPHRHKFDCALTEYMHDVGGLRMWLDDWTGCTDAPMGSVCLMGKRLMFNDSQGFVCHDKYPSARAARQVYDAIDAWYCEWDNEYDEEAPGWDAPQAEQDEYEEEHVMKMLQREQYTRYVIACASDDKVADDFDTWSARHYEPTI